MIPIKDLNSRFLETGYYIDLLKLTSYTKTVDFMKYFDELYSSYNMMEMDDVIAFLKNYQFDYPMIWLAVRFSSIDILPLNVENMYDVEEFYSKTKNKCVCIDRGENSNTYDIINQFDIDVICFAISKTTNFNIISYDNDDYIYDFTVQLKNKYNKTIKTKNSIIKLEIDMNDISIMDLEINYSNNDDNIISMILVFDNPLELIRAYKLNEIGKL